uniref:G-protein coupled receptors family 1 profile domain-containing protein n=1 Tax=Plectus sambesii TaxID=2011161 RepID=A0A914UQX1_9BILA
MSPNLTCSDVFAGTFLISFGVCGIVIHFIVLYAMFQLCREIVGFRFLISQGFADIFLMVQFGVWPGIVILMQDEVFPVEIRWHVHIYLDFTWWAMVYHYPIVAWSRLAAIYWPNWFRCLKHRPCLLIVSIAWITGLLQSLIEHQFPWFVSLYFDPKAYGMNADWAKYSADGTAQYYLLINVTSMILPFPFYGAAIYILLRRQDKQLISPNRKRRSVSTSSTIQAQRQISIETRLLIPCIINTILFVVGQLCINIGSRVEGKWVKWLVMVILAANSFVNPLLYLTFSSVIRRQLISDWEITQTPPPFSLQQNSDYPSSSGSVALHHTHYRQPSVVRLTKQRSGEDI